MTDFLKTNPDDDLNELLSPTEAATLNVPYGTTKAQAMNMGVMPKGQLTGQDKIDTEIKLSKNYQTYTKEAKQAQTQIKQIESSYKKALEDMKAGESINAASQGVLVAFQKLLDPTSVVRESEYARSAEGLSLLGQIEGKWTQIKQGGAGVSAQDLKEFYDLGIEFYNNYQDQMNNYMALTATQASNYGLNLANIIPPEDLAKYNQSSFNQGNDNFNW